MPRCVCTAVLEPEVMSFGSPKISAEYTTFRGATGHTGGHEHVSPVFCRSPPMEQRPEHCFSGMIEMFAIWIPVCVGCTVISELLNNVSKWFNTCVLRFRGGEGKDPKPQIIPNKSFADTISRYYMILPDLQENQIYIWVWISNAGKQYCRNIEIVLLNSWSTLLNISSGSCFLVSSEFQKFQGISQWPCMCHTFAANDVIRWVLENSMVWLFGFLGSLTLVCGVLLVILDVFERQNLKKCKACGSRR
jgi:hypothetical protein